MQYNYTVLRITKKTTLKCFWSLNNNKNDVSSCQWEVFISVTDSAGLIVPFVIY